MRRAALFLFVLLFRMHAGASETGGQEWLYQADSLRKAGQDAAALDFLQSAEQQFRKGGQHCWVARFAERKARIHLDWNNPVHASEALAIALIAAEQCPDVADETMGWRFELAQAKLDLGARDEARWILADLAALGGESDLRVRHLAVESMGRLARMSMDEGAFDQAVLDYDLWAEGLTALGNPGEALGARGWAAVCLAMDGGVESGRWEGIRDDPAWMAMSVGDRAVLGLGWARILLTSGALQAFDGLGQWPWASALERAPGTVDPILETQWALLRARRHRRDHAAQALAASHQAELAARSIGQPEARDALLAEALRLRAGILAGTGALGPAYHALHEADSLSVAAGRAERSRTGMFESEPWLSAIGDARTRMETERMARWRQLTVGLSVLLVLVFGWMWRSALVMGRLRSRLRRLQQVWLPGRQHQVRELALSGARLAEAARTMALPAVLQREMAEFGRLAALCGEEMRHEPVDLKKLCLSLSERHASIGTLDWSLHEEVPFHGDAEQLEDFLSTLLSGLGEGSCRMAMHSRQQGLEVIFDEFTERGWWRQAMTLFAGDGEARQWSLLRLRCDRLGGALRLDCDAAGARRLGLSLPVYSA